MSLGVRWVVVPVGDAGEPASDEDLRVVAETIARRTGLGPLAGFVAHVVEDEDLDDAITAHVAERIA